MYVPYPSGNGKQVWKRDGLVIVLMQRGNFFPPPINFQVNFDSFDGYILTGWNFLDLALKMTLQHDLQS